MSCVCNVGTKNVARIINPLQTKFICQSLENSKKVCAFMLIHRAVIRQRIRNWAPFLVTECRFQDTRGCSKIVCQQASGGEKVEATLLFSVKHQKGKDTPTSRNLLRRNLAYFRQRQPPRCLPDHTQKVTGC